MAFNDRMAVRTTRSLAVLLNKNTNIRKVAFRQGSYNIPAARRLLSTASVGDPWRCSDLMHDCYRTINPTIGDDEDALGDFA
jgi:hypothetical protein